jgi:cellulose synthase operon protein C
LLTSAIKTQWTGTKNSKYGLLHLRKKLQAAATKLYRDAVFLRAQQLEAAKEYRTAANLFKRFQTEFPKDSDADRSLYNAVQNYLRAADPKQALSAAELFLQQYAKSAHRADIIVDMATTRESLGQFEPAADHYYQLVREFPQDSRSPEALLNAALIWRKTSNKERATKAYLSFSKMFPRHKRISDCWYMMAETLQETNDPAGALRAYENYLQYDSAEHKMLAEARVVVLRSKLPGSGGKTGLVDYRKRLLATPAEQNSEARSLIAGLMFENLQASHKRFYSAQFEGGRDIIQQAQQRQRDLEAMVESYQNVIQVGSPEYVVASLYRLGELHESFYLQLYNAKAPSSMGEKEEFKFRSDLESAAFPLREQAFQFYETAFKRSEEVETFSEWTQRTYTKMSELAPAKHRAVRAQWISPSYLNLQFIHQTDLKDLTLSQAGGEK